MAVFGYRRRGYGRRYRRYFNRRGWTRSWRGGVNRRSLSGTRTFSCVVPVEEIVTVPVAAESFNSGVCCVNPYAYYPGSAVANLYLGSLFLSTLYRTYCQLYDEVKIDWVSVEIAVMDTIGQGGDFAAVRFWTAWDRKLQSNDVSSEPTYISVRTSSSAQSTLMVNNSRAVTHRYVRATDLQERITFHDCSFASSGSPPITTDRAWFNSTHNVMFFSPGLLFFFELNSAPRAQTGINCSLKVKYGVTFRNPKFGLSAEGRSAESGVKIDEVDDDVKRTNLVEDGGEDMVEEEKVDDEKGKEVVSSLSDEELAAVLAKLKSG